MIVLRRHWLLFSALCLSMGSPGCAAPLAPVTVEVERIPEHTSATLTTHESVFLSELEQLTFGGENAEAYFSFDGQQLSLQSRQPDEGCDRIYRMPLQTRDRHLVSSGDGATTCAHFFPDGNLLYASTHLQGKGCPPRPDHSLGYVWALYDSYDIFSVKPDGSGLHRLTFDKGYDAEGTVCGKDGSIIFTSTRDGDIELYRMDANGKNVLRLTHTPGYDGGAFFNSDCSKIVWRASRPAAGKELTDFQALLKNGLVRPSKLELWVANADGSEPMQLTYLNGAAFAPFFHPTENVILFSSNHGSLGPREFDIWAIRTDGTGLTQITDTPGFDGFPHFNPQGTLMAFSSNHATKTGGHDTNVFLATWHKGAVLSAADGDADRVGHDITWLAAPEREGRGIGTAGLLSAGAFLEARLKDIGLEPAGDSDTFRESFDLVTGVTIEPDTALSINKTKIAEEDFTVLGFSSTGKIEGELALAGYGAVDEKLALDDYAGIKVKNKIVVVRRFAPEGAKFSETETKRRIGDLRRKAWIARERGARGLVIVDWPTPPEGQNGWEMPAEAALPEPTPPAGDEAGLPVLAIKRKAIEGVWPRLLARKTVPVSIKVSLSFQKAPTFNLVGRLKATTPTESTIVIGAHYDHLGFGHRGSLAPDSKAPHLGADDNASGTAAVLEIARALSGHRGELKHNILFALFSAEEWGLLGSTHHVRKRAKLDKLVAMINLDMVGRLRDNTVQVLGVDTATEWRPIVDGACSASRITCAVTGDGYGPSDQAAFYPAGIPVLHLFTGSHSDYHKPSDTADRINAAGVAVVARTVSQIAIGLGVHPKLTYQKVSEPAPGGDIRNFSASLGTIPDYAGPPDGAKGVLLSGVRPGGAADRSGMQRGDILIRLGKFQIVSVQDLMFALNGSKPGETVTARVVRAGKTLELPTTFQESRPTKTH